jgi:hypothetical protein
VTHAELSRKLRGLGCVFETTGQGQLRDLAQSGREPFDRDPRSPRRYSGGHASRDSEAARHPARRPRFSVATSRLGSAPRIRRLQRRFRESLKPLNARVDHLPGRMKSCAPPPTCCCHAFERGVRGLRPCTPFLPNCLTGNLSEIENRHEAGPEAIRAQERRQGRARSRGRGQRAAGVAGAGPAGALAARRGLAP